MSKVEISCRCADGPLQNGSQSQCFFFLFSSVRSLLPTFQLERKKKEGTYKTKKQKEQEARAEAAKAAMLAAGLEGKLY